VAALPGAPGTAMIPGAAMAGADEDDDEDPSEAMINIKQVEGRVRASSMRKIGEIVEKHPEEAVAILRSWMYQTS
jgi:flagellar M-ring protein FliF